MTKRRSFLKAAAIAYPLSQVGSIPALAKENYQAPTIFKRDYFKEIGVTPFINAAAGYSAYGGARMLPEVAEAIRYGTYNKVKVSDLHDAVGKKLSFCRRQQTCQMKLLFKEITAILTTAP